MHQAKKERAFAAVGKCKAEAPRHNSLARSSNDNRNTGEEDGRDDRHEPPAVRRSQDRIVDSPNSRRASCPSPSAGNHVYPKDCADEVKREAALLYGIGRAPVSPQDSPSRAPAPGSATPSPDLEKRFRSSERKTFGPVTTPLGSRNGRAPASGSEEMFVRAKQSPPPSSSSSLPKLAWAIPDGVRGGHHTVNGGGTNEEGRQQQSTRDFAPMEVDGRCIGVTLGSSSDRNSDSTRGFPSPGKTEYLARVPPASVAFAHRSATSRDAMSSMSQTPGSPSVSGETDSDHSDSTAGPGAPQDDPGSELQGHKRDAAHMSGYRHGSDEGEKQCWEGHSRRVKASREGSPQKRNGYVAPLARLAAVATAGAR